MAVNLSPVGGVAGQFFDNNGNPLSGGKIFTYASGTTTNQVTYTNATGTIAHTNPIILDSAGRVPSGEIWLTDGLAYKFVIKNSNDVLIGTYDNIVGINSNFVNFTNEQEIQTATAGQTVFNLTTMQYQPGTNSLSVFVDGVNQYGPGASYAYLETDSDTVTFTTGLHVGAEVKFTTSNLNSSAGGDAFNVSYTPPFTGSVATNVGDKLAQTVSVKDFGAVGDGVTDDTAAIQAAIDAHDAVFVPYTSTGYKTTAPLYLSAGKALFGEPGALVSIFKTTNTPGSGSNTFGAQTDSYVKDAVVIVTHADNAYATYVNVENINFTSTVDCDYVMYAPRMYVGAFKNVLLGMTGGLYGFVTHDTFMFSMDEVQVAGDNSNVAGSVGFWWDDQGDGGSGTSVSFNLCWVRDGIETAYKFTGLVYSVLTACGADKYLNRALDASLCDLTLNGFGFENRSTAGVAPLLLRYSRININSAVAFTVNIGVSEYLIDAQGGVYNINGLRHTSTSSPASGRAYRVADAAVMNVSGVALSVNLADLTPSVDATSTFNQKDQNYIIGANRNINPYNGKFVVSDASGNELGYLAQVFSNSTRLQSALSLYLGASGNITLYHTPTVFRPYVDDNIIDLGAAAQRWKVIYAGTGTINTSDEREKQDLAALDDAEKRVALVLKGLVKRFRFKDAVVAKGDAARIHVGVIAQDVVAAFAAEGLDATRYGMLCYDEWEEESELRDENGAIVRPYRPAGNRYGVRYEELLAFIIGAM